MFGITGKTVITTTLEFKERAKHRGIQKSSRQTNHLPKNTPTLEVNFLHCFLLQKI